MNCALHKLPMKRDRRYADDVRRCEKGCQQTAPPDYYEVSTKPQEVCALDGCEVPLSHPRRGRPRRFCSRRHRQLAYLRRKRSVEVSA